MAGNRIKLAGKSKRRLAVRPQSFGASFRVAWFGRGRAVRPARRALGVRPLPPVPAPSPGKERAA